MPSILLDAFSTYLYALKWVAIAIALVMLISGLDDLFIDIAYWLRYGWRRLNIYRHHPRTSIEQLRRQPERPLAIMVPAWQETGVIGHMAEFAAKTLDYENYHIFVGTYPNDPQTQHDVDLVCARFPNVHKIVCARPGPTSKADCLNNVLDAIFQFERRARLEFAGFILHDAEDVVCEQELRLFNFLVERKDLIQIPVYPLERAWHAFTSHHYLDEFAELHGKDVCVREAIAGQVPSAGVGTCFSRRAVMALLADGNGIAFDVRSLTEDYDIGIRLRRKGMSEILVRFPLRDDPRRPARVVSVREFFPDTLQTAVRQKSRWIIGIIHQGYRTHGWTGQLRLDYFLYRDRKGLVTNFVSFLAFLILLQLAALAALQWIWDDAPHFLSIFTGSAWLRTLLWINLALMANRMLQRVLFVHGYYGPVQGLLAIPRLFWGNLVNFLANWRALRQVLQQGDPRRVAWDKTSHDFPSLGDGGARKPLGQILIEQGAIAAPQLRAALQATDAGLRLGSRLIRAGALDSRQLARALATQYGVRYEDIDPLTLPPALRQRMPAQLARHYAVLPLREEAGTLVVASENGLDPVSLAALSRKLGQPVRQVLGYKGQVVVGLRHWYAPVPDIDAEGDPHARLDAALASGALSPAEADGLWRYYVSRQITLGELLVTRGHIDAVALNALLLRFEHSHLPLGEFLLEQQAIDAGMLEDALQAQAALQPRMGALLRGAGASAADTTDMELA